MIADGLSVIWICAGALLAIATLPGTVELLLVTMGAVLPRRESLPLSTTEALHIAIIVPAHNEEAGIEQTVRSLLQCDYSGSSSIVVIADNCTDSTATLAARAGARVLVREDPNRRGKGYALDFAFQRLVAEGVDACLVVDADSVVEPNLVSEASQYFLAGADAVQCRYLVSNVRASMRTRLMNVALLAFNVLRPRGRDRWGLSAGILGNGFGLSSETLTEVPYHATSIVEDLEYHLRVVRAGRSVRFIATSTVWGDMPEGGKGATTQRARWEGGRFQMIATMAPGLAKEVLAGRFRLLEPLLELLLLPLAFHVSLLLAGAVIPFAPTQVISAVGLVVVVGHIIAAVLIGGGGVRDLAALVAAPVYILWKIMIVPVLARSARQGAAWVRTERKDSNNQEQ